MPPDAGHPDEAGVCATTHCSVVLAAGQGASAQAEQAWEQLGKTYWYPVYAKFRRRGRTPADAADDTQDFFASLIRRESLAGVRPERGRFRAYLKAALKHFAADQWARANAAKRGGGANATSLEALSAEARYAVEPRTDESPDVLFDRDWPAALFTQALAQLRAELARRPDPLQAALLPFLAADPEPGDYPRLAAEWGIAANTLAQRVRRLRGELRKHLLAQVRQTALSPADAEARSRSLFA